MRSEIQKFHADLLASVKQMRRGQAARLTKVTLPAAAEARASVGLSQQEFAKLLGVSARTLQDWEQGRREPTGAARTLLKVAVAIGVLTALSNADVKDGLVQSCPVHAKRGRSIRIMVLGQSGADLQIALHCARTAASDLRSVPLRAASAPSRQQLEYRKRHTRSMSRAASKPPVATVG